VLEITAAGQTADIMLYVQAVAQQSRDRRTRTQQACR